MAQFKGRDGMWRRSLAGWDYHPCLLHSRGISYSPTVGHLELLPDTLETLIYTVEFDKAVTNVATADIEGYLQRHKVWIQALAEGLLSIPQVVDKAQGLVRWPERICISAENQQTRFTATRPLSQLHKTPARKGWGFMLSLSAQSIILCKWCCPPTSGLEGIFFFAVVWSKRSRFLSIRTILGLPLPLDAHDCDHQDRAAARARF